MTLETLGTAPDGSPFVETTITSGELTAKILTFGAVLRDLRLADVPHPLVLGLERREDYFDASDNLGAIVGPVANRISQGAFTVQGRQCQLGVNEGAHTLHSGPTGTSELNWTVSHADEQSVTLTLDLADGHGGFPGPIALQAVYRVSGATLDLTLTASSNQATVATLAPHPYFNLDGRETIDAHRLQIAAKQRLPLVNGIPAGAPVDVARTSYDLRNPASVPSGLDDHYCLSDHRMPLRQIARLEVDGLALEIDSTEAGLQAYDGSWLSRDKCGLDGRSYGARAGVALEPHAWVDAPNKPWRAQVDLLAGHPHVAHSKFRFVRM